MRETRLLRILEPCLLLFVPVVLIACALSGTESTALLTLFAVCAALAPFFLRFEREHPKPRDIMPVVVLAAVAAAGRMLFAAVPNVKPVTAIVILCGVCFGRQSGFLCGALAAFCSNLFFGQGPWTPWQMYAWGLTGFLAGVLEAAGVFRRFRWAVYAYGVLSAVLFGLIMDSWTVVGFVVPLSWQGALAGYAAGIPATLTHAAATLVFLLLVYAPWKRMLLRMKQKFGIR